MGSARRLIANAQHPHEPADTRFELGVVFSGVELRGRDADREVVSQPTDARSDFNLRLLACDRSTHVSRRSRVKGDVGRYVITRMRHIHFDVVHSHF